MRRIRGERWRHDNSELDLHKERLNMSYRALRLLIYVPNLFTLESFRM